MRRLGKVHKNYVDYHSYEEARNQHESCASYGNRDHVCKERYDQSRIPWNISCNTALTADFLRILLLLCVIDQCSPVGDCPR